MATEYRGYRSGGGCGCTTMRDEGREKEVAGRKRERARKTRMPAIFIKSKSRVSSRTRAICSCGCHREQWESVLHLL